MAPRKARSIGMRNDEEASFFPRGAIAFFLAMVIFYAAFWFVMYALLAGRA